MRLDYGTQLSPSPITLSIGNMKKPTLREISQLSFDKFSFYEFLMKLTPELYYTKLKANGGKEKWKSMPDEEKDELKMYDIILSDDSIKNSYVDLMNFFFVENVVFQEGYFILLNPDVIDYDNLSSENIRGVISQEQFYQVLDLMQQICCIHSEEENIENMKFKNKLARKLYEQMLKAKKEQESKKIDNNLSLPNIISSLSNKHPSINYINIWDLTIFQLLDSFNRIQANTMYEIDSTRVSVWGDEKKTFDFSLWYRNNYDKKSPQEEPAD